MTAIFDVLWYKTTRWWNPYGDVVRWVEQTPDGLQECKSLVRRKDGLIFTPTSCHRCTEEQEDRHKQKNIRFARQEGHYLRGATTDTYMYYNANGRNIDRNRY